MFPLTLNLFGTWTLDAADGSPLAVAAEKERALLAFLALEHDRAQRRERVAGLLWPGTTEFGARQSLSHALYSLNGVTAPARQSGDPPLIMATRADVRLRPGAVRSDVQAFELHVLAWHGHGDPSGELCEDCAERLRQALDLYRGELLSGFSLRDSPEFGEWLAVRRERYHRQAVQAAMALAEGRGGEDALTWARRWVALDPLDEAGHRRVMFLLASEGQRTQALGQYETCRRLLQRELGVEPEEATRSLQARILAGELAPVPAAAQRGASGRMPAPPPHNLPAPVDSFVGREREMAEVQALLRDPSVRLVTLVGAGGMGKTRLALEVARACLDDYPDGVWFVDLAPLSPDAVTSVASSDWQPLGAEPSEAQPSEAERTVAAGDRVLGAVTSVLQVRQAGGIDSLVVALRDLRVLLLLDNCEHVLASAGWLLTSLLGSCAGLTVLATSREPLRVTGERAYHVLPLPYPPEPSKPDRVPAEEILQAGAVRLLAERAAAAHFGLVLESTDASAALAICRHLDGMPLAIELAAARLSGLTLREVAVALEGVRGLDASDGQRWALLGAGRRGTHPRQRTLLNTVAWSYGLLSEDQRRLYARLSVFAGSFTLQAAEQVCAEGLPAGSVPLLLAGLVDASLVQRMWGSAGEERYRLLETLRVFARERLAELGEADRLSARHAAFYVGLAQAAQPVLRRGEPNYVPVLRGLDPERDNLSAAIRWSLDQGGGEAALRISGGLCPWAELRDLQQTYARSALTALQLTEDRAQALALPRAWALQVRVDYYGEREQVEERRRAREAMYAAALKSQDPAAIAWGQYWASTCVMERGDRLQGRVMLEQSLALAQACGEPGLATMLALITLDAEPRDVQVAALDRIVAGAPDGYRARCCTRASQRALNLGDLARAEMWARDAIDRYVEMGSLVHAGARMRVLAEIVAYQARLDEADRLFADGSRLLKENGEDNALVMMLSQRCEYAWLGMRATARGYAEACLEESRGLGERTYGTVNRLRLARAAYGIGERELGRRLQRDAAAERTEGEPHWEYFGAEACGWDAYLCGDMATAAAAFRTALDVAVRCCWRIDAANTTERLAWPLAALGETDEAAALLAEAERERHATGLRLFPVEVAHHERAVSLVERRQGRRADQLSPAREAAGRVASAHAPHNLPYAVDSFVGRDRELGDVHALLRDPAVRLVTLVGAGGMGKTRLALEVARTCLNDYPDGVWFVDLAPLSSDASTPETLASGVAQALAEVLDVRAGADQDLTSALVTALQDRRLLLIIDNCEHVLRDVASLLSDLLARCGTLTLLATSREPLRIAGEHLYELPALGVPELPALAENGPTLDAALALAYDAVRLLAERGAAARFGATLVEGDVAAAVQICQRLDGMPLAIELAAARLNALTLRELADGLDGHFDGRLHSRWSLLSAGSRAAHPRQRTMLNTVAWSYGLLGEEERLLFDRLSVFAGSFALEAAAAVCAGEGIDAGQVPALLAALVDCSLVQRVELAGASRYRLLETLRAYGQERLDERGEQEAIARSHAEFFSSLAERAAPVLRHGEPDYFSVLHSLSPDRDNLEAAIRWSLRSGTGVEALRITGAAHFWAMHNQYMPRYMVWAQQALERTRRLPGVTVPPLVRARALDTVANQLYNWTRLDEMERVCTEQRAAAEDSKDPSALAWAGWYDGRLALSSGRSEAAEAHYRESQAIARDCGEIGLASWLEMQLAIFQPLDRKIALMDRTLERTPEGFQALAFQIAADQIIDAGEFARAERYYSVSIGRWAEAGNVPMIGALKWMLATTLAPRGRLAQAAGLLDQGAQEGREGGDMVAWVRSSTARCELAWLARDPAAGDLLHAYLRDPAAFGPRWYGVVNRLMLAKVAFGLGDHDLGCRLESEALAGLTKEFTVAMHLVYEARGWGAFLTGDMPAAAAAFRGALAELRGSDSRPAIASNREHLAWALAESGELEEAASLLEQARSEREAMGIVLYPVEVPHYERALALVGK